MSSAPVTKFRRILWQRQDFEDNYTPSFPYCVRFNENARYRSFGYLLMHSLWVLDHISLVILFFDVFLLCDNASIYSSSLFLIDVLLVLLDLIISFLLLYFHTSHQPSSNKKKRKNKPKQSSSTSSIQNRAKRTYIIGILLIILCPFLRTLTESIATDTIWTMTIICAVIHLLTAEYEFENYNTHDPRITATVSLNASVFMSVLLASRLKSNDLALSFLLFSFILFGGSTYIIRDIKLINSFLNVFVSLFMCVMNYGLICYQQEIINRVAFVSEYIRNWLPFEMTSAVHQHVPVDYRNDVRLSCLLYVYQYSMFVIVVLGPIGFFRIQQYKVTIGGPWTYDTEGEASQYMLDSSNIKTK
eukprot:345678_1